MSEQFLGVALDRRRFLGVCSVMGLGQTLLPGALFTLAAQAEAQTVATPSDAKLAKITPEMIAAAAAIAGLTLTDAQKEMMLVGLTTQRDSVMAVRELKMPNSVAPALVFDPVPA